MRADNNSGLPFLEVEAVSAELRDVVGAGNAHDSDFERY
jgi:hypothetical protein